MFQRIRGIRGAIDAHIAEEQARQKAAQESLARSNSNRRPAAKAARPRQDSGTVSRGPDPIEFEPEFAIGDDDVSGRPGTPQPESSVASEVAAPGDAMLGKGSGDSTQMELGSAVQERPSSSTDLPTEVRVKLRRLDKLESKYHELLKAYRIAHARVLYIEPFEASLRENTPLTSINDPKALTEYLNQLSLKGDMVLDELKRVTADRDEVKKSLEEVEKSAKASKADEVANLRKENIDPSGPNGVSPKNTEVRGLAIDTGAVEGNAPSGPLKSPSGSFASRNASLPGISLFSPKPKSIKSPLGESEEFFSFDNEIPRLESELQSKREEIEKLKSQVDTLKRDLSVTRESTEGMVHSLEASTCELEGLREDRDKHRAQLESLKAIGQTEADRLRTKLASADAAVEKSNIALEDLRNRLKDKTGELERTAERISGLEKRLEAPDLVARLSVMEGEKEADEKRLGVLEGLVNALKSQLKDSEAIISSLNAELAERAISVNFTDNSQMQDVKLRSEKELAIDDKSADGELDENAKDVGTQRQTTAISSGKKRRNRRRKPTKNVENSANELTPLTPTGSLPAASEPPTVCELEARIEELSSQLKEKDTGIEYLHAKLKGEEDLKEEIETLRDNLLHLGQDHVEAKDQVKKLLAEKAVLEENITKFEEEVVDLRSRNASSAEDSDKANKDSMAELDSLKAKAATLELDLSVAQQLAATRFKDLTDVKETLQRFQPELRNLRADSTELRTTREDLKNKTSELKKLENKHDDIRAELKTMKATVADRDVEVKTLNQRLKQEIDNCRRADAALLIAQSDLRFSEGKKQEALETNEKTSRDLSNAQDDLRASKARLLDVEDQVAQLNRAVGGLREEIQLKTAQHASAQSLLNSMRDQASEMAMQMKEARERCESLEEELADVHRLLSERSREGETMRRLLNDIESRADAKIREFKERMEAAIEERDRAEEETNAQGRRRAREMEELKVKAREAERALKRAEEDKEELEYTQRDWKRRRDDLEAQSERSAEDLKDIRQAMAQLRDALDESERQVRELEKEKGELRRSVEETSNRLEKLRKVNKALTDESRAVQNIRRRGFDSDNQSSRSSIDSPSRRGIMSPTSGDRDGLAPGNETPLNHAGPLVDYIYLKNVLLQFLEQRDKNNQKQLIPVLGTLLHFDRTDEQKWMSVVMSR